MQDSTFNGERTQRTGNSSTSTFINICTYVQPRQSCNVQARNNTTDYNYYIQALKQVLLVGHGATHTHTQKQKKRPPFTVLESLSHDCQRGRAWLRPPTRSANPLRHPSSGRAGPPDSRHCCASRPRLHQQAARRTTSAGPREGERERCTEKKEGQRGLPDQRKIEPRVCAPFIERGSALRSTPFLAPPPSEKLLEKGAFLTPDRVTPRIHQSGASRPTPLLLHSSEKQAGKIRAGSARAFISLARSRTVSDAETVAAWSVVEGVRKRG